MEAWGENAKAALGVVVAEASALVEAKMRNIVAGFESDVKGLTNQQEKAKAWGQKAEALEAELKDKNLEIEALHEKVGRTEEEVLSLQRRAKRKAHEDQSLIEEAITGAIGSKALRNKAVSIFAIFERIRMALDDIESSNSEQVKADKSYSIVALIDTIRGVLRTTQSECSALAKRRQTKADLIYSVFETIRNALREHELSFSRSVKTWVKADATRTTLDRIFESISIAVGATESIYGPPPNDLEEAASEAGCEMLEYYCEGYFDDDNHADYCDLELVGEPCYKCERKRHINNR